MNNSNRRIVELEDLLKVYDNKHTYLFIQGLDSLVNEYEALGNMEKACQCAREIVDVMTSGRIVDELAHKARLNEMLVHAYDCLARGGDFRAFCIALEWNRKVDKKFYIPRMRLLEHHGVMQAFQDMADDKLDLMVLNLPPRVGKSTISLFFLVFMAGLHPDRSILGTGHSTMLVNSFFRELLEIVSSDEYRYGSIFKGIDLVDKNNEYTYLDLDKNKRFHTISFRSVDAGTTGAVEASNLLYCDDLVKDAEQANNKDRLDTLYAQYTSSIKDRKVQRLCKDGVYRPCPELHVNTPWSVNDVTNRIIRQEAEKGNDRVRIISIPCWNEKHESNFLYEYGKGFDVGYYEDMELAEDPVIFSAKYLMKCIERDGRPFERANLTYYTELPSETPDRIVAYNDVSHGGKDYMSMPVAYCYGNEIYIEDVLFEHEFGGDQVSRKWVCDKLIEHNVSRCGFEKNNGGDFYATMIDQDLKNRGYRCNITSHTVNTRQRKLDIILACQSEITGVAQNSVRIYFKDPNGLPRGSKYMEFMEQIWSWSQKEGSIQKTQHDDSIDSIAGLITNVLGNAHHAQLKVMDIGKIGY